MRCVCVQVSFGTFATTRGSLGGLWGSAGLWCKMGLLGGLWGSTGNLGLNWEASGAQLGGLWWKMGLLGSLWGSIGPAGGYWRLPAAPGSSGAAPWASGGSWRPLGPLAALGWVLTPGGLGESLLGSQTVTVKTLVENRVENGVEII